MSTLMTLSDLLADDTVTCILDVETNTGAGTPLGPSAFNNQAYFPKKSLDGLEGIPYGPRLLTIGALTVWGLNTTTKTGYDIIDLDTTGGTRRILDIYRCNVIVGHNIKFDILWLLQYRYITIEDLHSITVIDTAILDFHMTGHQFIYPSLNGVAARLGLGQKHDEVKEWWNEGYDTEDIPKSILHPYLEQDVNLTYDVYKEQLHHSRGTDKALEMAILDCHALKSAIILEWNGIYIDQDEYSSNLKRLSIVVEDITDKLRQVEDNISIAMESRISNDLKISPTEVFDSIDREKFKGTDAIKHWILHDYDVNVPILVRKLNSAGEPVVFKSGKKKGQQATKKTVVKMSDLVSSTGLKPLLPEEPLSAKTIAKLPSSTYRDLLLNFAKYDKELSTYFVGMKPFIGKDSLIHGNLNFCAVTTGRLSSSKPNLQNISGKDNDG